MSRIVDAVIADLLARAEVGREQYGEYLHPFNGRNALQDAYEELLDLSKYLKQELVENELSFALLFNNMAKGAYRIAIDNGWYDRPREIGTEIALMHSELSEALEALRRGNEPDKHLPEFSSVEVEFADLVIRLMDTAAREKWDIGGAIVAKMEYNKTRSYRHGDKKF